ncbi:MAG: NmrA family NAD(P)-binding protein [Cyanobacteria bacterium P01_H01_bin.15]
MNLLVVGATGTLGRQIARYALEQKIRVRCLVRSYRKASFLREWGAELVQGDICEPETLPKAMEGMDYLIDAATARATDSLTIKEVDWQGKVNLIQAAKAANIKRFVFFSILNADKFPDVPLMEIKRCTEQFLAEAGLEYTTLQLAGFMQGLIGQYAIPILDNQAVWVSGESTPIAYANTEDIGKFAVRLLNVDAAANRTLPVVGTRAWAANEIIQVCEKLSGKQARISRLPMGVLRATRKISRFFAWGLNASDRLAFAEVLASGIPLDADMSEVYKLLDLDPKDTTTLENYFQEYFNRIQKKLKEIEYEKNKAKKKKKKRSPFKSNA